MTSSPAALAINSVNVSIFSFLLVFKSLSLFVIGKLSHELRFLCWWLVMGVCFLCVCCLPDTSSVEKCGCGWSPSHTHKGRHLSTLSRIVVKKEYVDFNWHHYTILGEGGLTIKKKRPLSRTIDNLEKSSQQSRVCVYWDWIESVNTGRSLGTFLSVFLFSMNNKRILEITDSLTSPSKTCSPQKFNTHKHTHLAFMLGWPSLSPFRSYLAKCAYHGA